MRGDVILRVDGRAVNGAKQVLGYLAKVLVDQDLLFELWRDGKQMAITVRAEEIPAQQVRLLAHSVLGLALGKRTDDEGFRIAGVREGSHAAKMGFRAGDRLMAVNGRWLAANDDLRRAMVELRGRVRAVLVVQRGSGRYHVTIPLV